MSGALSQQAIFPTYGQKVIANFPPPALSFRLDWDGKTGRGTVPGLVPIPQPSAAQQYSLNLNNIVGDQLPIPILQSMYCDNTQCPVDVVVQVSQTNVQFVVPAFSFGIYPLICGKSPLLTFSIIGDLLVYVPGGINYGTGPTFVALFAELLTPFIHQNGQAAQINGMTGTFFNGTIIPGTAVFTQAQNTALDFYSGVTTLDNRVFQTVFSPASGVYGRFKISDISFNIDADVTGLTAPFSAGLAFFEYMRTPTNPTALYTYRMIFARTIVIDPLQATSNKIVSIPTTNIALRPAYIGTFRSSLVRGSNYASPSYGFALNKAIPNISTSISISTQFTVGVMPGGNARSYADVGGL